MENKENTDTTPTTVRTPSADEDDVITTSTESETFGTWTLVTDKNRKQQLIIGTPATVSVPKKAENTKTSEERVEELQQDEHDEAGETEMEMADPELKTSYDSQLEDFSDGISIISESESGGRFSPHPFLRHHLQDLNLKFRVADEYETTPIVLPSSSEPILADFEVKKRYRKRSASISHSDLVDSSLQPTEVDAAVTPMKFHPIIRTGLTGVFYVGVLLAVLAFIGRLRYPEWEPLNTSKPIEQLEQKLTDMELQNNLMRAEIDILSKQVNYLTNLKDNPPQQRGGGKDQKPYKVWPGNEAQQSPPLPQEPISIEFRKPYKCPNGKYVANADLCVKEVAPTEKLLDIEVDNAEDEDDTMKEFEKVVEQMNKFGSNVFKTHEKMENGNENDATAPDQKGERKYDKKMAEKFNKDYFSKYDSKSTEKQQRNYQHEPDSKESNEKQGKKYNNHRTHSKEDQRHKNDVDDSDEEISNERFNRHRNSIFANEHNSKERNSKERFSKHDRQQHYKVQHNSKESLSDDKDGHWHENLMHHREQERQRNNERQNNDKNWYIKRGNSREQIRHGEKRFR